MKPCLHTKATRLRPIRVMMSAMIIYMIRSIILTSLGHQTGDSNSHSAQVIPTINRGSSSTKFQRSDKLFKIQTDSPQTEINVGRVEHSPPASSTTVLDTDVFDEEILHIVTPASPSSLLYNSRRTSSSPSPLSPPSPPSPKSPSSSSSSDVEFTTSDPNSSTNHSNYTLSEGKVAFVSFCPALLDTRRLGNRLFNVAALLHVAWTTGRRAAVPTDDGGFDGGNSTWNRRYDWLIDRVFNQLADSKLVVRTGYDVMCGDGYTGYVGRSELHNVSASGNCVDVMEENSMIYETTWETSINHPSNFNKSILLCGYLQSWKYFKGSETQLRHALTFNSTITSMADQFFFNSRPNDWNSNSFATVGIHVRRGDLTRADKLYFGYVVPPAGFYLRAVRLFLHRYERVLFVVSTDDPKWAREVLGAVEKGNHRRTSLVFTASSAVSDHELPAAEMDLAVLSRCQDGAIVSTGTFGWWAAWIANPPIVIYYAGTPRRGSKLDDSYHRDDYVPPHWRPLY